MISKLLPLNRSMVERREKMKKTIVYGLLALLFTLRVNTKVFATTWAPKEVNCPLCQTKNTFKEPMSWGSYIYSWPEKFQYIFWPLTDKPVLYCCKKCHLTAFM